MEYDYEIICFIRFVMILSLWTSKSWDTIILRIRYWIKKKKIVSLRTSFHNSVIFKYNNRDWTFQTPFYKYLKIETSYLKHGKFCAKAWETSLLTCVLTKMSTDQTRPYLSAHPLDFEISIVKSLAPLFLEGHAWIILSFRLSFLQDYYLSDWFHDTLRSNFHLYLFQFRFSRERFKHNVRLWACKSRGD